VPSFIDEVFDPFYTSASKRPADYSFGQIFTVPAYYPHQKLEVWRPKSLDAKLGIATDFQITTANDVFRRPLPYSVPRLKTNEEFIALKAKCRPVILVQPPDPSLLQIKKSGYSGKVVRHLCPVALVYSAEDEAGNSKFSPDFLERVRRLEYRQFLFLPQGGSILVDSIARLDEIQSVAESQLWPTGFSLSDDVREILRSQVSFFLAGLSGDEFAGWAALLNT
jgi:hypothetical protein